MKKIVFFTPTLNGGGAERVLVNYLKILAHSSEFDIHLFLISDDGILREDVPSSVNVKKLESKKTLLSVLELKRLIDRLKPEVVYSTLINSSIALYLSICVSRHKPKLILRSPNSPILLKKHKQVSGIMSKLLKMSYLKADTIVAQTSAMRDEIGSVFQVDADKICTIHNPLDIENIDIQRKNGKSPFEPTAINVVTAGRIIDQKGFDTLIKAFALVLEENKKFVLHIIGNDVVGLQSALEDLASRLNINKYVFFHGFKANPYLYFEHADLYVMSSRWEGLPNAVLENLYLRKPVVATDCIPIMRDIIEDGQNGFLVPVDNVEQLAEKILGYASLDPSYSKNSDFNSATTERIFNLFR